MLYCRISKIKTTDPGPNGSKHSIKLIYSLFLHAFNYVSTVSFPDICTSPKFHIIYWLSLCCNFVQHSVLDTLFSPLCGMCDDKHIYSNGAVNFTHFIQKFSRNSLEYQTYIFYTRAIIKVSCSS
jgi:hypothetical protein